MSAANSRAAVAYRRVSFEARVMASRPADLTAILNEELVVALAAARRHTAVLHRSHRSAALTRTLTVLNLLERGLDFARGGDVATALGRWYDQLRRAVLDQVVRPDAHRLDVLAQDAREMEAAWASVGAGVARM